MNLPGIIPHRMLQLILTAFTIFLLTGCEFLTNTLQYKESAKVFVETLIKEDYDQCIKQMAMQHPNARNANVDTLKRGLAIFREQIVKNFGTKLEYSLLKSHKNFSTKENESTPENATEVFIEISNEEEFGVLKLLFDDTSNKILHINLQDVKERVPSMTLFWLFGLLAICVPAFNVYIIREIKNSTLTRKWAKYLAVILLNLPTLTYSAIGGFTFKLLYFQFLLGISFSNSGYAGSVWSIGIPLGGLYWFWKLKQNAEIPAEGKVV